MDLTGTLTDDSEAAAVDGLPSLPTLPPAPTLPPRSLGDFSTEVPVPLDPAWVTPSPKQMNHAAANAPYGVMPAKPRAGEPSPAALQAAEQRRRTKKRRRIRRLVLLVIAIAVVALAGPPAVRWMADGFDKAGSIGPESQPSGDDTD